MAHAIGAALPITRSGSTSGRSRPERVEVDVQIAGPRLEPDQDRVLDPEIGTATSTNASSNPLGNRSEPINVSRVAHRSEVQSDTAPTNQPTTRKTPEEEQCDGRVLLEATPS
jgi:hypothetical protein